MSGFAKMIHSEALQIFAVLVIYMTTGMSRDHSSVTPPVIPVQVFIIGKAAPPETQATVYSATWCKPCVNYVALIKDAMPKDGWLIKHAGDQDAAAAHIIVTKSEDEWKALGIEKLPCTIIRKNGKEVKRFYGGLTPDELADEYNRVAKSKD